MLLDNGAVSAVKSGPDSWSATVREGKRLYKAAVKVISATNLETRCACPENQSSGALCSHGVAAGLAALGGQAPSSSPARQEVPNMAASGRQVPAVETAFNVSLPVNWVESLRKGRLSATLTAGKEITAADGKLSGWLQGMNQPVKFPLHLNLDPANSGLFLKNLIEHPKVSVGKTGQAIEVREGGRLAIDQVERADDTVILKGEAGNIARIGGRWWSLGEGEIVGLGQGIPSEGLDSILEALSASGVARIKQPAFLENLTRWQEWMDLPEATWLDGIHFVPARAAFELTLEGSLQKLEASIRVRYGDESAVPGRDRIDWLPKLAGDRCEVRDWQAEEAAINRLVKSGFQSKDSITWVIGHEQEILRFLSSHLPSFQADWKVIEGARFATAKKQVSLVAPKIEILGSGEDWLSFNLLFQSDDGSIIPASEIRRLLAGGKAGSGRRVVISEDASNTIEPLLQDLDLRQEGGHFVTSKAGGEVIEKIRKKLQKVNTVSELVDIDERGISSLVNAEMRQYQTIGSNWLADRAMKFGGAILADDMGLGKTLQAIACIEYLYKAEPEEGMVLVIATTSLLGNWNAEFSRFAPMRKIRILHGTGREKQQEQARAGEVLLTTFGTLPRDLAWYLKQKFKAVIVDEASLMRNPDTDHAKAISRLDSSVRIALTGTPIENGVRDLWSIFRFVQPGWLGGREQFKERYEVNAENPGAMERLRLKTSPFLLRRTKEEVAPELPSKIFIDEFCDLSSEQQSVYRDLLAEGRKKVESTRDSGNQGAARIQILTALLRLRQVSCDLALLGNERFKQLTLPKRSAKVSRLLELVREAVAGNHKMLIFSQFKTQLQEIENCLIEEQINCLKLDGATRKRQEMVDRFQSGDGPPVFLISLKAGGYGLNLTAADIVIHFDPWWNPAAEAQATDRAHRIGQTRPVTVYKLIARGTVEEKVVSLQNKKRRIASAIDESGEGDAAGWSERELMDLMES